jgi:hypothetical protein
MRWIGFAPPRRAGPGESGVKPKLNGSEVSFWLLTLAVIRSVQPSSAKAMSERESEGIGGARVLAVG